MDCAGLRWTRQSYHASTTSELRFRNLKRTSPSMCNIKRAQLRPTALPTSLNQPGQSRAWALITPTGDIQTTQHNSQARPPRAQMCPARQPLIGTRTAGIIPHCTPASKCTTWRNPWRGTTFLLPLVDWMSLSVRHVLVLHPAFRRAQHTLNAISSIQHTAAFLGPRGLPDAVP